jgi:hypothetical protein
VVGTTCDAKSLSWDECRWIKARKPTRPVFLQQAATSPLTKAKKTILNLLADEQQKQRNAGDLLAHKDVSKHDP